MVIVKRKSIGLSKLNNSEYANFSTRFVSLVATATTTELGITPADFTAYTKDLEILGDIIAQSRISEETAQMAALEKERDGLLDYLFAVINASITAPIEAQRKAAVPLGHVVKPYTGMQYKPNQQQTILTNGLIRDLSKTENMPHVTALRLSDTLEALDGVNGQYATLTDERNIAKADSRLEDGKTVRTRMTILYDTMSNTAFAQNIITPTAKTTAFINHLNSLIDEINALYNLRNAERKPTPAEKPADSEKKE